MASFLKEEADLLVRTLSFFNDHESYMRGREEYHRESEKPCDLLARSIYFAIAPPLSTTVMSSCRILKGGWSKHVRYTPKATLDQLHRWRQSVLA